MATHVAGRAYSGQVSSLRKISASSTVTLTWTTKHNEDHRNNIPSNIYGLFLKENIMMNIFIVTTWQKGSRQSSCSSTRRARPRPPQTRPLHTVSTRSTFTSSYIYSIYLWWRTSTWKKADGYLETLDTGQIDNPTRARAGCQGWAGGRHIFNQSLFVGSRRDTETSGQIHAL